jgi:hypothetical protein
MTRTLPYIQPRSTFGTLPNSAILWVKRGIYLYFWLLILEGALRKWVFPQFSASLLIVRDPVVLFVYWQAYRSRKLKSSDLVPVAAVGLAVAFLAAAQMATGTNDLLTALFGVRCYFLHLPLIFVMKQVLTVKDIKKIGIWVLLIALPMAVLMMAQFRAPESSWLNKGAGEGAGQISFTGEHVRASGTFSFVTGSAEFFPLVTVFLFFAIGDSAYPKSIVAAAAIGNVLAIPLAGSRSLLFAIMIVCCTALLTSITNVRAFARLAKSAALLLVAGLLALQTPIFQDSIEAFETRWNDANHVDGGEHGIEGVLESRVLAPLSAPFEAGFQIPLLGRGIGMGSNVAAALRTGDRDFLLSEDEWPRVFEEFGLIFGCLFMGFRVWLCFSMVALGLRSRSRGSNLSLLLAAAAIPLLAAAVMEQPTNLGFMVFASGLCFASATTPAGRINSAFCSSITTSRKDRTRGTIFGTQKR